MEFFQTLASNSLFQMAFLAGLAISILSGMVGSYVVVKRISFISGSISHAVLGGIGFSLFLKSVWGPNFFTPVVGALCVAVLSALFIGFAGTRMKEREDTLMAVVWSLGMSLGVIFMSQTPSFGVELNHFLVGNLLWTSRYDLGLLFILNLLTLLLILAFHRSFFALCFDADYAALRKIPTTFLTFVLLILIAVTVVLVIQVVGIILVLTLLTIPASIANRLTTSLAKMMGMAACIASIFFIFGMAASFYLNFPPGATVAFLSSIGYALSLVFLREK